MRQVRLTLIFTTTTKQGVMVVLFKMHPYADSRCSQSSVEQSASLHAHIVNPLRRKRCLRRFFVYFSSVAHTKRERRC